MAEYRTGTREAESIFVETPQRNTSFQSKVQEREKL